MFGRKRPAGSETPIGRCQAVVRPDTSMEKDSASLPPKNPILREEPELEYLSERIKRAKKQLKSPMSLSPQFQRPILQQSQQQRQLQRGTNVTQPRRQHLPTTDSESGSSRNVVTFFQDLTDNPQNCIVQRHIDGYTAKMLVVLQNGEQRLITFDIPDEDCTVQDLLEQANILICPETSIYWVQDNALQVNYVVDAGPEASRIMKTKENLILGV